MRMGLVGTGRIGAFHAETLTGLPGVDRLASFGEDACGRIYAASLNGPVYRIGRR
jgi:myo-inositol 2-dehydrogenase/D-chiro-inositol 1-dehydrogenase